MALHFLEFDYSDDGENSCTWDALANVRAERLPELLTEVTRVLAWAHTEFGSQRGPLEEGYQWDYDLQCERDGWPLVALTYDLDTASVDPPLQPDPGTRVGIALSISGTRTFAERFAAQFGVESP